MSQHFQITKKVYLYDTDATGIVYYARHLEWLEMARIEFIGHIYKPLTRLIAEDQTSFIPISVRLDYKAAAVFEDLLTIKLWLKGIDKLKMVLAYEVTKEAGGKTVKVSEAEIEMLCINTAKGNRPAKIPEQLISVFSPYLAE